MKGAAPLDREVWSRLQLSELGEIRFFFVNFDSDF